MHVTTLLNPFFDDEYMSQDDGQKFDVFTKINLTPQSEVDAKSNKKEKD